MSSINPSFSRVVPFYGSFLCDETFSDSLYDASSSESDGVQLSSTSEDASNHLHTSDKEESAEKTKRKANSVSTERLSSSNGLKNGFGLATEEALRPIQRQKVYRKTIVLTKDKCVDGPLEYLYEIVKFPKIKTNRSTHSEGCPAFIKPHRQPGIIMSEKSLSELYLE